MISRDWGTGGWAPGCQDAPPPLHVYDTESIAANWYPYVRPVLFPTPPGPIAVTVPTPMGADLGDDPTDPARQSVPRMATNGMVGRFNTGGGAS